MTRHHEMVGKTINGFRVLGVKRVVRDYMLRLRCAQGHEFLRNAYNFERQRNARCVDCKNATGAKGVSEQTRALRRVLPEVCGCTYYGGVLRRVCKLHETAVSA